MRIFDSHCHIEHGLDNYTIEVAGRNVIFNSIDAYHKLSATVPATDVISIIFDYKNHFEEAKKISLRENIKALKIHSRIQELEAKDYPKLIEKLQELPIALPIIVDAVYYGDQLQYQPNLQYIITIARQFKDRPVVIAHSGGYEVLKYFYHLKTLENIYFDLSLSLSYYRNSSVFTDFKNLLKFGDKNKIIFGTDYPLIDPAHHLATFMEISEELNLSIEDTDKILFQNSKSLFC